MSIIERASVRMQRDSASRAADAGALPSVPAVLLAPAVPAAPEAAPALPVSVPLPLPLPPLHSAPARDGSGSSGGSSGKEVVLDSARLAALGFVVADSRTPLMEEIRVIKRPLIRRAFAARQANEMPGNLIMITSSLPGEGKTFCAINLAISIAMEIDHTVLLVDADVARPSVMRTLGLPAQRGLMDLLLDEHTDMADVMLHTNINGLTLLPAGTANPRATELLASQNMLQLLGEIARRYTDRIIIFDSPPLLLTTESHVLAMHMGQIVVVVEAEVTTEHALRESLRQLEGLNYVNLVYNKTREFSGASGYDSHYSYDYHHAPSQG